MRRAAGCLLLLVLIVAAYLIGRDYVRRHPQDVPWTSLDLDHPIGRFTVGKIAGLGEEPGRCRMLVRDAGVRDQPMPPRQSDPDCGYEDGMRLTGRDTSYTPAGLVTSCPVAAALHLLETRVIEPAAQLHFGRGVAEVLHAGSYSCRRINGRAEGRFSEHATADAIDVIGFRLEGGRQVSVLEDWHGTGPEAAFLRDVRDGACDIFTTVLSPDYNAAHRDHLHFDVANRGGGMWTLCR